MTNEIISIRQIESASPDFTVYEILTDRINHINDYIVLYKVITNDGLCYLTDNGYTLNELKMHGMKMSVKTIDRIDQLLADHYVYRGVLGDTLYTGFCSEDDFDDEVTGLLDAIEALYKEFLE